jgi:hypothetical protein
MPYRIFFSGLMSFIRYENFKEVDVLILNPCAEKGHTHPGSGAEDHGVKKAHAKPHTHKDGEALCEDRHLPQLTVQMDDVAEWNLAGVVHGCGWRHFDLTGKTLFTKLTQDRQIELPRPGLDEIYVYPVGTMRHVAFEEGIIDMAKVLEDHGPASGHIDRPNVSKLLKRLGKDLIAARVRLPKGKLTALAPLDRSARSAFSWKIGSQSLQVLCETVMFVPDPDVGNRIDLGDEYLTLRNKPDVTVWISAEPLSLTRSKEPHKARHFDHYFKLLPTGAGTARGKLRKLPQLELSGAALNLDTPICPQSGGETNPPLPPP